MNDFNDTDTVAIKPCVACRGGMIESDKYCRWCGACQQPNGAAAATAIDQGEMAASHTVRSLSTRGLEANGAAGFSGSVSGPLLSAIMAGVTISSQTLRLGRGIRRVIVALVALPVWLIVVLLSPVDAYVALRGVSSEQYR